MLGIIEDGIVDEDACFIIDPGCLAHGGLGPKLGKERVGQRDGYRVHKPHLLQHPRVEKTLGDTFDESYNLREAIDFLNDKLGVREKLIQSARQFSEKNGAQKFSVTVKRFEDLYTDFLRLYQPIFDKIAGRKDAIQSEIMSQKDSLTGVVGMIQVAKGVEVLQDRVRELESEAKGIETAIAEKTKTLEKIDEILERTRRQSPEATRQAREESLNDISDQPDDFILGLREPTKTTSGRKSAGR